MTLTLTIDMDNAAFFESDQTPARNAEVARILHAFAQRLDTAWDLEPDHGFALMDSNGNKVGKVQVDQ